MREHANDWASFWETKTDEWLAGYCWAEGTEWYDRYDSEIVCHWHQGEMIITVPELGEEE